MYRLHRTDGSVIAEGASYRTILADLLVLRADSGHRYRWQKALRYANLAGLDLAGVELTGADLAYANLVGAKLTAANLTAANLAGACLHSADLSYANLCQANFSRSVLVGTDLNSAVISADTCFTDAILQKTRNIPPKLAAYTSILPEGDIVGWKKCYSSYSAFVRSQPVLVKLKIPANAKRTNATGRKCRAEFAEVLAAGPDGMAYSFWRQDFIYRNGETVHCGLWEENHWFMCCGGIHFFITKEEAEAFEF